jgi:beta-aspartyl-peptidase (threonine type)
MWHDKMGDFMVWKKRGKGRLVFHYKAQGPAAMRYLLPIVSLLTLASCSGTAPPDWALVVHGGAGTIYASTLNAEQQADYHQQLDAALLAGEQILQGGGASMDAVTAAIQVLEQSPLFNAGRGAVFTHEGRNELDASIMDGRDLNAGAVAGVTVIKSPIAAARAVMEESPHVMLSGTGAEEFAREQGLEIVEPAYFYTERRWQDLQKIKHEILQSERNPQVLLEESKDWKFGTVGAVALDSAGNLAAGTSTGGMTNKRWGRIGDAPVIGAGTYAANESCAVSATGHGEYFIRRTVARDICARVQYAGTSLPDAAAQVIHDVLEPMGGEGGIIALDTQGNMVMDFNSPGMFRGSVSSRQARQTALFQK